MGGRNRWRPTGQEAQKAEWEAAKRRILGLAESDHAQATPGESAAARAPHRDTDVAAPAEPRLPYEGYLLAVASTLVRRHRHRVPINRGHWPPQEDQ
ncbi:hypothetical protein [Micromonospora aurantiaca]|uniref:hypothetical protein n=1 Tax=Micromonospora aurantiaca (nom. illeg.) TaxID=47850 RepID=UPI00382EBEA9